MLIALFWQQVKIRSLKHGGEGTHTAHVGMTEVGWRHSLPPPGESLVLGGGVMIADVDGIVSCVVDVIVAVRVAWQAQIALPACMALTASRSEHPPSTQFIAPS